MFDIFKNLFGKKDEVAEVVIPKNTIKKDIYTAETGDIINFGHNDLTQLIEQSYKITSRLILESNNHKMIFLVAKSTPELPVIYIDITTHEEHITIYKEVSPEDVFSCLEEGNSPDSEFASHLLQEKEDNGSFEFDQNGDEELLNQNWFNKKRYYVRKKGEYKRLETKKNVTVAEGNNVEDVEVYWFEADQREYNFLTVLSEGVGHTILYAGRRIEPHDISSIDSPE